MEQIPIKAIEMIRHIREAHYELLKNKSGAERILFYQMKAQSLRQKLMLRQQQKLQYLP